MSVETLKIIFIAFVIIKTITQIYLLKRNMKSIEANKSSVPKEFDNIISLEEHQKAADYEMAKSKLSVFKILISNSLLLFWTVLGGFNFLAELSAEFSDHHIYQGLVFISLYSLAELVLGLPFSYYSTFIIEEKFGFNKMTLTLFLKDMAKGLVLGAIIGLPLFALVLYVMTVVDEYWWVYTWAILTVFQLVLVWAYPRIIAPIFNKFSPLENGDAKDKILELMNKTGFESNGLFVMDASIRSSHGNAYFTGFGKSKRIVFFDTLLKQLSATEVQAVLAHELGHFKHKHIVKSMILSLAMSFIGLGILGSLYKMDLFYKTFNISNPSDYLALILFMTISGVFTFYFTPLFSFFSRKNEFEADSFAAKNTNAEDLIHALLKLFKENASFLVPDEVYSKFYYSHPPAIERVNHLRKISTNVSQ